MSDLCTYFLTMYLQLEIHHWYVVKYTELVMSLPCLIPTPSPKLNFRLKP
jgi:hypothetical protein